MNFEKGLALKIWGTSKKLLLKQLLDLIDFKKALKCLFHIIFRHFEQSDACFNTRFSLKRSFKLPPIFRLKNGTHMPTLYKIKWDLLFPNILLLACLFIYFAPSAFSKIAFLAKIIIQQNASWEEFLLLL